MRGALLSWVGWAGAIQAIQPATSAESIARLVGLACVMASVTMYVFTLGRSRQAVEDTKNEVVVQIKSYREEISSGFGTLYQRLDGIDHLVTEHRDEMARMTRRVRRMQRRVDRLESQDDRGSGAEVTE